MTKIIKAKKEDLDLQGHRHRDPHWGVLDKGYREILP